MRDRLTEMQRNVLDVLAEVEFDGKDSWVRGLIVRKRLPGDDHNAKQEAVRSLVSAGLIEATGNVFPDDSYRLTFSGLLASNVGHVVEQWMEPILAFLHERFRREELNQFSWEDLKRQIRIAGWQPTDDAIDRANIILTLSGLGENGRVSGTAGTWNTPRDIEELRKVRNNAELLALRIRQNEERRRMAEKNLSPNDLARRVLMVFYDQYKLSGRRNWWAAPESDDFEPTRLSITASFSELDQGHGYSRNVRTTRYSPRG